jgi:hypothetical protein
MQTIITVTEATITAQHEFNEIRARAFFHDAAKARQWADAKRDELAAKDAPEWNDYFIVALRVHDIEDA